MLVSLLALVASAATPFAGATFSPLSRADLTWVGDAKTSGVEVGEFDGFVHPTLQAFGGAWFSRRWGLEGSLGLARLTSTTWTGDTWRQRSWGVFRPEVDGLLALGRRIPMRPAFSFVLGLDVDVPSARDTSNEYTTDEQKLADDNAYADRLRLGGVGGVAGGDVDFWFTDGIALGVRWTVDAQFGILKTSESSTISSWVTSDAAFTVTFAWPKTGAAKPPSP